MYRALTPRWLAPATALVLGAALCGPPTSAVAAPDPGSVSARARATVVTDYALGSSGFATRVTGGALPVGSSRTAFEVIGCTRLAGLDKSNDIAGVNVPGLGTVEAATTRTWTTKARQTVSAWSRTSIAEAVLADSPVGRLSVRGVSTTTRSWHDASGYHAKATPHVARIVFDPAVGPDQVIDLPAPGREITIPGVASLKVGTPTVTTGRNGASAQATALTVDVTLTGTTAHLAFARSRIAGEVPTGLLGGNASALSGSVLDGTLEVGRNAHVVMPCQGTHGAVRRSSVASAGVLGLLSASGLEASQAGDVTATRAWATERSRVAQLSLLGHGLVVKAVSSRATASKPAGARLALTGSSSVGDILLDGERLQIPATGVLTVPGIARLSTDVRTETARSISVVALRIELLDGTGAMIDVARSFARYRAQ